MPSELHEQLARAAERRDVSLNRYVTDALATSLTPPAAEPAEALTPDETDLTPEPTAPDPSAVEPKQPPSPGVLRVALATNLAVVVLAGVVAVVLLVLALQRGI
jgi:hypothetical protein